MQFKHPEIFYFLFVLLIPIVIHLFQLQRFQKTAFTNVAFLKQLELQTRKSSRLKKWFVLLARLLILLCLIVAFAQPYRANSDNKPLHTIVVLDNSISMQAQSQGVELLKSTVQSLLENLPNKGVFSLITQDDVYDNLDKDTFKETLKSIDYVFYDEPYYQLLLQAQTLINQDNSKQHQVLWLTDLQKQSKQQKLNLLKDLPLNLVCVKPDLDSNVSIDSVYIQPKDGNTVDLFINVKNQGKASHQIGLSAYQNDLLVSKTFVDCETDHTTTKKLELPATAISERLKLTLVHNDRYSFDNQYYISFDKPERIKVLQVADSDNFIKRILTSDKFDLKRLTSNQFPYDHCDDYNCIILNSNKLLKDQITTLEQFVAHGGSVVFIPNNNIKLKDINQLLTTFKVAEVDTLKTDSLLINKIHYDHSLFSGVFERRVNNFDYPMVKSYFSLKKYQALPVLSFEGGLPFLMQKKYQEGQVYTFLSTLDRANSNFINAPLVVPIVYKMALMSRKTKALSYRLGHNQEVSIPIKLTGEKIVTLTKNKYAVIPLQTLKPNSVSLMVDKSLKNAGFYDLKSEGKTMATLACNVKQSESNIDVWSTDFISKNYKNISVKQTVRQALNQIALTTKVVDYFKWFILLALIFLVLEMIILKYL